MRTLLLLLLLAPSIAHAQWVENFAFRDTDAYCTDPTDTQSARCRNGTGSDQIYPVTNAGVTFGFVGATPQTDCRRDRTTSNCSVGLAGMMFYTNNTTNWYDFRVDLPAAGTYDIRCALGDPSNGRSRQQIRIYDTSSLLATIGSTTTTGAGQFLDCTSTDASPVLHTSAANWASGNTALRLVFSTTEMHVQIGRGDSVAGETDLSFLGIEQVATDNLPRLQAIGED